MNCPSCEKEVPSDQDRCPSCDCDLAAAAAGEFENLAPVLETADSLFLAETRSALWSVGIPSVIQGAEAAGLLPVASILLVPREKVGDAEALMHQTGAAGGDEE
jgi:hypothetical protein